MLWWMQKSKFINLLKFYGHAVSFKVTERKGKKKWQRYRKRTKYHWWQRSSNLALQNFLSCNIISFESWLYPKRTFSLPSPLSLSLSFKYRSSLEFNIWLKKINFLIFWYNEFNIANYFQFCYIKSLLYIRTLSRFVFQGWSALTELHPGICKLSSSIGTEESRYVLEGRF